MKIWKGFSFGIPRYVPYMSMNAGLKILDMFLTLLRFFFWTGREVNFKLSS